MKPEYRTLKSARMFFCTEAARWAAKQPDLKTAWRRCPNGCWMAWWLWEFRNVAESEVRHTCVQLWLGAGASSASGWFCGDGIEDKGLKRRYADLIRKHFDSSGRRLQ